MIAIAEKKQRVDPTMREYRFYLGARRAEGSRKAAALALQCAEPWWSVHLAGEHLIVTCRNDSFPPSEGVEARVCEYLDLTD